MANDMGATTPSDRIQPAPQAPNPVQTLPIRFTGSGSEYFRIWIVNLLLILVTFTLYWPFARARRLAYFQNNTLLGDDPLGFHADPWKMFRGYLVVLLMGVAYWAITTVVPSFTVLLLLVLALVWPALWRASLQFRLRNSSWRGVRMAFTGDLKGAYLALVPFFLPALVMAVFLPGAPEGEALSKEQAMQEGLGALAVGIGMLALFPWLFARLKRYQHAGYSFAGEQAELRATTGSFYGWMARVSGLMLLVGAVVGGVVAAIAMAGGGAPAHLVALVIVLGVAYLLVPLIVVPYATAGLQNLLWANTRSQRTRFRSDLRFKALLQVTVLNWFLIAVTLGLYWPFAQVRLAKARLEAMSLQVKGDVDTWMARVDARRHGGVFGDAAGDFVGLDMGL